MNKRKKIFFWHVLMLGVPFVLWVFLFRDFISGRIFLNVDTLEHYAFVKYYFNNLLNGVFPLWQPFVKGGRPFVSLVANVGIPNPFLYIVGLLRLVGLDYFQGYIGYIVTYYLFGLIGFYLLARRIFGKEFYAYSACVLLLFSGLGAGMFNQVYAVLCFVSAAWCFYFILRFYRTGKRSALLGIVFSMLLACSRARPTYLATLLILSTVVGGLIFWSYTPQVIARTVSLLKQHKRILLCGGFLFGLALLPFILLPINMKALELISPHRHPFVCGIHGDSNACLKQSLALSLNEASQGGSLGERVIFPYLFAHLDKISYMTDDFFFIPLFGFLLIVSAVFTFIDKRRVFLLVLGLLVFGIAMGELTPMYAFFYKCLFYFRYIRNNFL